MRSVSEVYTPQGAHELVDAEPSEHYSRWGYSLAYEKSVSGLDVPVGGNTAVFSIEPGGFTEPVFVTKPEEDAEFRVQVLSGRGFLTRTEESIKDAVSSIPLLEGDEVVIKPGEAYMYRNTGTTEELILHDEAMPAFKLGDDVDLTSSELSQGLAVTRDFNESALVNSRRVIYLPSMFYSVVGNIITGRY